MSAYQKLRNFLFQKSIELRLAEACRAAAGVKKLGDNGEYSYLRILDIANALRDELFSRGIVLIPNDVECESSKFKVPDSARVVTEVRVKTEFTVSDGNRSIVFAAYGVGRDMDGKALFAAQTGALKSWLKRLGLIFGDRDDPEVEARKDPQGVLELPKQKAAQLRYQERAWTAGVAASGKTQQQIEEAISMAMGKTVTSDLIVQLPSRDFDVAMQILARTSDLTETLQDSVKAAARKRSKAQPIVTAIDHQSVDEVMAGD